MYCAFGICALAGTGNAHQRLKLPSFAAASDELFDCLRLVAVRTERADHLKIGHGDRLYACSRRAGECEILAGSAAGFYNRGVLAKVHSHILVGIEASVCEVEVDVAKHGTDKATMVGLPTGSDISLPVDANTVVEFLSR